MASSDSFNTTDYAGRYLTFAWTQKSQDITNNKTTISWTLKGAGGDANTWYWCGNVSVVIAGSTVFTLPESKAINLWAGTQVASGEYTFTHNSDGTKSFTASVAAGIYVHAATRTGSGTFTLNTIARASQPSCITWPDHTEDVGEFGDTISIHMNRKSDAFTHTVRYEFGAQSGTIATGVGTGTTWTIPLNLMHLLPNATSGAGRIYVDTYNGSTKIGTKYCGFRVTVPASVKPTCSLTLEDITGVGDIYGVPVQGLSKIKITVNATPIYSSPIVSYAVSANGASYMTKESTTDVLKDANASIVRATIKDGRGRTASASYTMRPLPYSKPSVTKLTAHRSNADGIANDQGSYVRVIFSASVSPLDNKNVSSYSLRYKKSTETDYTEVSLGFANVFSVENEEYIFAAEATSSYDVELVARDRHNSTTRSTSASTALSLLDFGANGTSIGVGKTAERERSFEVAFDAYFAGDQIQTGNRYVLSSPGTANATGYVRMARISITAANADTPITFVLSQRQQPSTMTVYVQLKNSTLTASSVTSCTYEGSNYGAFLCKIDELNYELLVQKGSSWDTIALQDWYTSDAMAGRISITFPGDLVSTLPTPYYRATPAKLQSLLDFIYPVGSVYISYSHVNPGELFGGTWVRMTGGFLWASQEGDTIGQTGGAREVALTIDQIPAHSHGSVYSQHATGKKDKAWYSTAGSSVAYGEVSTGGGAAHNNMPPYIQVSIWRRTA